MRKTSFVLAALISGLFPGVVFADRPQQAPVAAPVSGQLAESAKQPLAVTPAPDAPKAAPVPAAVASQPKAAPAKPAKSSAPIKPASIAPAEKPPVPPQVVSTPVSSPSASAVSAALDRRFDRQPLPGIGELPGQKPATAPAIIHATPDRNEIVYVAEQFGNRIATPFAVPRAISVFDETTATIKQEGQSLYVQIHDGKPLGIYVTGSTPGDPVISLTLVPKSLPAQTVLLQVDATEQGAESKKPGAGVESPVYEDRIRQIMRAVALGSAPAGFVEAPLPKAVGRVGALVILPETRYSNAALDVFRYRVESASVEDIELDEASFNDDGVRAVALYPKTRLRKGESTTVFVLSDKSALGGDRE